MAPRTSPLPSIREAFETLLRTGYDLTNPSSQRRGRQNEPEIPRWPKRPRTRRQPRKVDLCPYSASALNVV